MSNIKYFTCHKLIHYTLDINIELARPKFVFLWEGNLKWRRGGAGPCHDKWRLRPKITFLIVSFLRRVFQKLSFGLNRRLPGSKQSQMSFENTNFFWLPIWCNVEMTNFALPTERDQFASPACQWQNGKNQPVEFFHKSARGFYLKSASGKIFKTSQWLFSISVSGEHFYPKVIISDDVMTSTCDCFIQQSRTLQTKFWISNGLDIVIHLLMQ